MKDNVINLDDYNKLLELQKKYEDGLISEDDMTLEEIDALHKLYLKQIKELKETLATKVIKKSKEWYQ